MELRTYGSSLTLPTVHSAPWVSAGPSDPLLLTQDFRPPTSNPGLLSLSSFWKFLKVLETDFTGKHNLWSWSYPLIHCKSLMLSWHNASESNKAIPSNTHKAVFPRWNPIISCLGIYSKEIIQTEAKYYLHKSVHWSLSLKVKNWEPDWGSGLVNWDVHTMGNQAGKPQLLRLWREREKCFYYTMRHHHAPPRTRSLNEACLSDRGRERDLFLLEIDS